MTVALGAGAFAFGLVCGLFATWVIDRVLAGEPLARAPDSCPSCAEPIPSDTGLPLVRWIMRRGRCPRCPAVVGSRYFLLELAMGALFAAAAVRIGLAWSLPGFLLFVWLLLVVSIIDARIRRIPNRLTYPLTPALLGLLALAALLEGEPGWALRSLLGGLAAFTALLVLALINPRGMGMGDVKIAGFIGLGLGYLGWGHVVLGVFTGFLLGGVTGLALLATRVRTRKDLIPFGPYLAAGGVATLLVGEPFIEAYRKASTLG